MIPNAKQEKAPRHEEYKRYELSVDRPGTYINNAADKHRWVQLISSTDNRGFKSQSIISLAYHSIPGQQDQPMYMMTTCMLLCQRLPFHSNLSAFQTRVRVGVENTPVFSFSSISGATIKEKQTTIFLNSYYYLALPFPCPVSQGHWSVYMLQSYTFSPRVSSAEHT